MREYVPSLIERTKRTKRERNAAVGDVVLIVDENSPRGSWPTGQITKVLVEKAKRGRKQTVRAAIVKTENGEYRRPVVKLYLLNPVEEADGTTEGNGEEKKEA